MSLCCYFVRRDHSYAFMILQIRLQFEFKFSFNMVFKLQFNSLNLCFSKTAPGIFIICCFIVFLIYQNIIRIMEIHKTICWSCSCLNGVYYLMLNPRKSKKQSTIFDIILWRADGMSYELCFMNLNHDLKWCKVFVYLIFLKTI